MDDESLGTRLRACRRLRGLTLQQLADQVGLSKSYLSLVENGHRPLERRSHLHALAEALNVALSDLTGVPYRHVNATQDAALATVPRLREVLLSADLDDPPDARPSAWPLIVDRYTHMIRARYACDWALMGTFTPALIEDLTTVATSGVDHRDEALRMLAQVSAETAHGLRDLGFSDLGWVASQRSHAAAARLNDPVVTGMAAYSQAQSLLHTRARTHALRVATRAADALAPHVGARDAADEVYGMLLMMSAFLSATLGERGDGAIKDRLNEAAHVAERTGETLDRAHHLHTSFGPINVGMWRSSVALECGDPERAVAISLDINVDAMPRTSRRASHLIERGVAMARLPRREREAIATLREAERLAPQRVHASSSVRETVTTMLTRARLAAGGRDLRALASRIGVG